MGKLVETSETEDQKNPTETRTTAFNSPPNSLVETAEETVADSKASEAAGKKKGCCICAPTNHPGSFRCRLHQAGAPWFPANNLVAYTPTKPSIVRTRNAQPTLPCGHHQPSRFARAALAQRDHPNEEQFNYF